MNHRILAVCPSRSSPLGLEKLRKSVRDTSTMVKVVAYIDEDQRQEYSPEQGDIVGPRIGPAMSANMLVGKNPGYDVYGFLTDDCRVVTPGWDDRLLSIFNEFPGRIGAVSPWLEGIPFMSFPFVSREWIAALGYFCHTSVYHFCWDTMIEMMAEHVGIWYATEQQFEIIHPHHVSSNLEAHWDSDRLTFFNWCLNERPKGIASLKDAR